MHWAALTLFTHMCRVTEWSPVERPLKKAVALPRDIAADLDAWLEPFLDATGRKTRRKKR